MNTRQKLTDMTAFLREIPAQFRIARRGAITAIAQQQSLPPNPLGTVSHTAPAEGQGAHPGGVIRGRTPCATTPPRRDVSRSTHLRVLARRARAQTLEPGWPFNGTGNWSSCIEGLLGGATGEYCAALRPDVVVWLLDERDRYRDALTVIADNPCATGCDERLGTEGGQWCNGCLAREALNHE